jgi:hypothetical protein
MTLDKLERLMKSTSRLTTEEQLLLASRLIERARQNLPVEKSRKKWRNLRGIMESRKLGEDAQVYITRSRAEDDAHRTQNIRRGE